MEDDGASASTSKTASTNASSSTAGKKVGDAKDDSASRNADYLGTTLLTDVLNKKKMSLMHSPEVIKFFQEQQRQKLKPGTSGNS